IYLTQQNSLPEQTHPILRPTFLARSLLFVNERRWEHPEKMAPFPTTWQWKCCRDHTTFGETIGPCSRLNGLRSVRDVGTVVKNLEVPSGFCFVSYALCFGPSL